MLAGISFDRERMAAAAADEMVAATDIADLLVRRGLPFREAHAVVGGLVRHALEQDIALSEIERATARRVLRAARRRVLRGARRRQLARLEALRRWHLGRRGQRPARAGRPGARRPRWLRPGRPAAPAAGRSADRARLLRPRSMPGRPRAARLRAARRRGRRAGSSRPRPTPSTSRPATPTSA